MTVFYRYCYAAVSEELHRNIAEAFQYMKIIEGWGTGLPRLFRRCEEMGLPEPKFEEFGDGIKVTVYRAIGDTNNEANDTKTETDDTKTETDDTKNMVRDTKAEANRSNRESNGNGDEANENGTAINTDGKTDTNRKTDGKTDGKTKTDRKTEPRTETEIKLLQYMGEKPEITIPELADKLSLSESGIRYAITKLRDKDLVLREGSRKQGKWIVNQ